MAYFPIIQVILVIVALAIAGAVAITLIVLLIGKFVVQGIKKPLEERIAAVYQPDEIVLKDLGANCFGLESAGVGQWRGNGGLVLTREAVHFFRFLPKSDLRIPLSAITDLTLTKRHKGKISIYDLLKINFTADGRPDSAAWYVAEPAAWIRQIDALRADKSPG
jgi:hypothetical protein